MDSSKRQAQKTTGCTGRFNQSNKNAPVDSATPQIVSLMHRLEENGIRVALSSTSESSKPTESEAGCPAAGSSGTRKRKLCSSRLDSSGDDLNQATQNKILATDKSTAPAASLPTVKDVACEEAMHYLDPHQTAVKCMFSSGPCLFTASEDATIHVYDLVSGQLSMRVLGHQEQVTCLYSIAMKTTFKELKSLNSTSDYLYHLSLITGSRDGYVRQFSLADGNLLHEKTCKHPITCMVAYKYLACFFLGTDAGLIYTYNLKDNVLTLASFKVLRSFASLAYVCYRLSNDY